MAVASAAAAAVSRTAAIPRGDWLTFDGGAGRSGDVEAATGITRATLRDLRARVVTVPGTVDSAAVELTGVAIGGRARDVAFMTTSYGITFALDLQSGQILWQYVPPGSKALVGGPQITASTPVLDPDRDYLYAASPTGTVAKLRVATGGVVWMRTVVIDPTKQKLPSALNIAGTSLLVTSDGYYGDAPPYQGHVVSLDLASGRITAVFNALCSHQTKLIVPSTCSASDAGIWGRSGTVVEPDGNILVATGNAPFNGSTNWGDSVLELSPALRLLHNWTPQNQQQLNQQDLDLGSTEPAILPAAGGVPLAVQGGKQGIIYLLDLARLDGTTGPAGPRLGGDLQQLTSPGSTDVFTAPAVWTQAGRTLVIVADDNGTAAYSLGADRRLSVAWQNSTPGTSPVIAGGLLYIFNQSGGQLDVRDPRSGRLLAALPAASGHWNSPIVVGGRIILPVGNDNNHDSTGRVFIYHLPGR